MKKLIVSFIAFCFFTIPQVGFSAEFWPVIHHVIGDINSGATIQPNGGVSLVYVINQSNRAARGYYNLQPGMVTFGGESTGAQGVADPGGTGASADSSVTVQWAYGISDRYLTIPEWEAKGIAGTTDFYTFTVGSGQSNEPLPFTPEFAVRIGIFFRSGMSVFLVPKPDIAHQ